MMLQYRMLRSTPRLLWTLCRTQKHINSAGTKNQSSLVPCPSFRTHRNLLLRKINISNLFCFVFYFAAECSENIGIRFVLPLSTYDKKAKVVTPTRSLPEYTLFAAKDDLKERIFGTKIIAYTVHRATSTKRFPTGKQITATVNS